MQDLNTPAGYDTFPVEDKECPRLTSAQRWCYVFFFLFAYYWICYKINTMLSKSPSSGPEEFLACFPRPFSFPLFF